MSDDKYDDIATLIAGGSIDEPDESIEDAQETHDKTPENASNESTPTDDTPDVIEGQEGADIGASDAPDDDPEGDDEGESEDSDETDYEMLIPMPDDMEPMKLGEMKDMVSNYERNVRDVDQQRLGLIKQETELSDYMQQSGIQVPEGFREHMAQRQQEHLQSQHSLMMRMVPEMADPKAFDSMKAGIVKVALESNFTHQEIGELADARLVHLLNRLAVLEARQTKAQETVKQVKRKSGPKGLVGRNKTRQSKVDKIVAEGMKKGGDAKYDAIAALIN